MCRGLLKGMRGKGVLLAGMLLIGDARGAGLVDLINEVSMVNPEVLASRLQVQAAEADIETARWQFYPTPSFSVRSAMQDSDDAVSSSPVSVFGIEQPLWTGGRLRAGLENSQAARDASKASLDETRQAVALRLVQAYSDWYASHFKGQAVGASLDAHRDLLRQIDRRISEGLAARSDRTQVRSRIEQIEADVQAYQGQAQRGVSAIQQLIGRQLHEADLLRRVAVPLSVATELDRLRQDAFAVNPSLQRASASIKVAEANLKMAKATVLPRVSLSLEHQWNAQYDYQPDSSNRAYLTVASDLGAGLSARSKRSAAAALADSATQQLDAARLQLVTQLDSDRLTLLSMRTRKGFLNAAVASAEAVRASYARQYLQGRRTWLDVMNAEREVAQLQVQSAEVMASQLASSWRLGILTRGVAGISLLALDANGAGQ